MDEMDLFDQQSHITPIEDIYGSERTLLIQLSTIIRRRAFLSLIYFIVNKGQQ
jgi:hypothetical protein